MHALLRCLSFMKALCICTLFRDWQLQKCTFQHFTEVLPGLLMYMWMGLLLLSDCKKSSWAITRLATESSIWAEENEQQHKSLWKHVEEKNVIQSPHPVRHLLDPLHKWFSLSGGENRCHTLFLLSPEEKEKRQNCLLKRKNKSVQQSGAVRNRKAAHTPSTCVDYFLTVPANVYGSDFKTGKTLLVHVFTDTSASEAFVLENYYIGHTWHM